MDQDVITSNLTPDLKTSYKRVIGYSSHSTKEKAFGDRPHNIEPWLSDEDDTPLLTSIPYGTLHTPWYGCCSPVVIVTNRWSEYNEFEEKRRVEGLMDVKSVDAHCPSVKVA
ncbi:hypothetical protein TNCV_4078951 [Trichonephila clavipes]|nr:hypothetical protein TNCV_4078951 [Trichonephila clavipes]